MPHVLPDTRHLVCIMSVVVSGRRLKGVFEMERRARSSALASGV